MNYLIELYRVLDEGEGIELIFKLNEGMRNTAPQKLSSEETSKHVVYFPDSDKIYGNIATANKNIRERYIGFHTDFEEKAISTAIELYDGDVAVRVQVTNVDAKKDIVMDFDVLEIGKWHVDHWETIDLRRSYDRKEVIKKMNLRIGDLVAFTNRVFNLGMITR